MGRGGGFGAEPTALSDISREVQVLAWAMPFRIGAVTAGRGVQVAVTVPSRNAHLRTTGVICRSSGLCCAGGRPPVLD